MSGDDVWNAGMPDRAMADFRVMLNKAALFDVLAARIEAGAWVICDTVGGVKILLERTGERVFDVTLAGAVEKAMEAENAESHTCPVCDSAMDSPPVDHEICGNCKTHFGYHDAGPRETWQERIELLRRAYAEQAVEKAMEAEEE